MSFAADVVTSVSRRAEDDHPSCYFLHPGLRVVDNRPFGAGRGIITEVALLPGEILLIEASVLCASKGGDLRSFRKTFGRLCPSDECSSRTAFMFPIRLLRKSKALDVLLRIRLNGWWAGLFAFGSYFNHSCAPNVQRVIWKTGVSVVVAGCAVAPGSELLAAYGWSNEVRFWRRVRLWERYGFWCHCDRCQTGSDEVPLFPETQARFRAQGEIDNISVDGMTSQSITLFSLMEDVEEPNKCRNRTGRKFARAFAQMQLLLEQSLHAGLNGACEQDDTLESIRYFQSEAERLSGSIGADAARIRAACLAEPHGRGGTRFEDALGPVAVSIFVVNAFRVALLLLCMSTFVAEHEAFLTCMVVHVCSASVVGGVLWGIIQRRWQMVPLHGTLIWFFFSEIATLCFVQLDLSRSFAASFIALFLAPGLGAFFAHASACCSQKLENYEEYLVGLTRGEEPWGQDFVH
eukprot:TRINITY_DN43652_c0_g1_i1.p1 TRINITY_DN43652_c0_g1~~TRINITY_DN43652_c0_g1_i1.p1  ORF type:complete len:463 (+),score=66.45 TRINITY_DN43652_c0_g1_i1:61-1449(+)